MRSAKLLAICLFCVLVQSQPPAPAPAIQRTYPKQPSASGQQQSTSDKSGTETAPIFVKIVPSAKTQEEAPQGKPQELGQSSPDWWMVWLTGAIASIGLIQTIVFGVQAHRLKQTITKMDEIATGQTRDIQASIAEATRSATAMEGVATSMALNVEAVKQSVGISREIADRQELVTELASRAYLTMVFGAMTPQDEANGVRFQPHIQIVNRGNTPAYNIRFHIASGVVPFPVRDDFVFPLPNELTGHASPIGPGLHKIIASVVPEVYPNDDEIKLGVSTRVIAWGIVRYQDAFDIERFIKFGFTFYQVGGSAQWMSMDTERHNESD